MPFPYVPVREFREEYAPDAADLDFETQAAYEHFLERILEHESARVEGDQYADRSWRSDATAPPVVYEAVVRLARIRIDSRNADILSSEQSASGRQESYRPPAEVREQVREELHAAGYGSGDFWSVTR